MSRQIWEFPGGVHPPQNKSQSNQTPIAQAELPKMLVIPLQQHIGAPSNPVVSVGDKVLKGQVIAEPAGFVSTPQHAPSSGTVVAIGPHPIQHPSQLDGPCISIETDGEDQWIEHQGVENYQELPAYELVEHIRMAGISGMGGAGFPTAVKLSVKDGTKIEQLVINAVECEPYITADDMLMRERAAEVIIGIEILAHILKPKEILMGIEDNKPEAIAAMQKAAEGTAVEIVVVPTKYPSGGEKQIIQVLTGKEVPHGGLPADVGVVCQNTGTTYAVYRAVVHGEPLISRITTVTGDAIAHRGNFEALIGTPAGDLLRQFDLKENQLHRLVMGGPMMGFTLHDPSIPVVKTTNCLLAATATELVDPASEQPCIRCGSCAQACPMSLLPQQLYWFSKTQQHDQAQNYNLMDCIECGACAYVCPSNIPLVQYYRHAKGEIRMQAQEAMKAERSRQRFEARQARLEQEAAEKEAKRRERAERAAAAQKAKKEAAAKAPATDTGQADQEVQLKTALAKATKKWKDAEKALEKLEASGQGDLEKMRAKVADLKAKVDEAQTALDKGKSGADKAAPAAQAKADDPLADLKSKAEKAFKAYQATKEKCEAAQAEGSDKAEALEQALAKAKEKSDAAKQALREARDKQREEMAAKKGGGDKDPMELAKQKSQVAFEAWQKAKQLAEEAEASDAEDAAPLRQKANKLKEKSDKAKAALKEAREQEKERIREQNRAKQGEGSDSEQPQHDLEQLKKDAAAAEKGLKKTQQALTAAQEAGGDTSKLEAAVQKAEQRAQAAAQALQQAENGTNGNSAGSAEKNTENA